MGTIFIAGIVILALYLFFKGGFRRHPVDVRESFPSSGSNNYGNGSDSIHQGHLKDGMRGKMENWIEPIRGARRNDDGSGGQIHLHHQNKPYNAVETWIDPVCNMPVEIENAVATRNYEGLTFYFCSEKCLAAFERRPEKYVPIEETHYRHTSGSGRHGCCG